VVLDYFDVNHLEFRPSLREAAIGHKINSSNVGILLNGNIAGGKILCERTLVGKLRGAALTREHTMAVKVQHDTLGIISVSIWRCLMNHSHLVS
jgi:hypothetical protein